MRAQNEYITPEVFSDITKGNQNQKHHLPVTKSNTPATQMVGLKQQLPKSHRVNDFPVTRHANDEWSKPVDCTVVDELRLLPIGILALGLKQKIS